MPELALRRFLLDTNIVIAIFAQEAGVLQRLQQALFYFLPSIVLGELYYGARKSGRVEANVQRVEDFVAHSGVYTERSAEGTNLVKLDPDVAAVFATPEAVNAVLRALIQTMPKANRAEAAQ